MKLQYTQYVAMGLIVLLAGSVIGQSVRRPVAKKPVVKKQSPMVEQPSAAVLRTKTPVKAQEQQPTAGFRAKDKPTRPSYVEQAQKQPGDAPPLLPKPKKPSQVDPDIEQIKQPKRPKFDPTQQEAQKKPDVEAQKPLEAAPGKPARPQFDPQKPYGDAPPLPPKPGKPKPSTPTKPLPLTPPEMQELSTKGARNYFEILGLYTDTGQLNTNAGQMAIYQSYLSKRNDPNLDVNEQAKVREAFETLYDIEFKNAYLRSLQEGMPPKTGNIEVDNQNAMLAHAAAVEAARTARANRWPAAVQDWNESIAQSLSRSASFSVGKGELFTALLAKISPLIPTTTIEIMKGLTIRTPTLVPIATITPAAFRSGTGESGALPIGGALGFGVVGAVNYKGRELVGEFVICYNPPPKMPPGGGSPTQLNPMDNAVIGAVAPGQENATMPRFNPAIGLALLLMLPPTWNISDEFPTLKALDQIGLFSPILAVSNFMFLDYQSGAFIRPGLNIIGNVDLTGPFEPINRLVQMIHPAFFAQGNRAIFQFVYFPTFLAALGSTVGTPGPTSRSYAMVEVPLGVGIDFGLLKVPKWWPFTKIQLSNFQIFLDMYGLASSMGPLRLPTMTVSSGIYVWLKTQLNPLEFRLGGSWSPPSNIELFGSMEGFYEQAFGIPWLTIGNLGLEIDYDIGLVGVIPPPIPTGIGIRGDLILGEPYDPETKVIQVAGKTQIRTSNIPDFVLMGSINEITLTPFVKLLSKAVGKVIPIPKVPLVFRNLRISIVPIGTTLAGKYYPGGLACGGEFQIGNYMGVLDFSVSNEQKKITGTGYLQTIDAGFIRITGIGPDGMPGTPDDGLTMLMDISLLSQNIYFTGKLEIPFLGWSREANFSFDDRGMFTELTAVSLFGMDTTKVGIRIPFTSVDDLLLSYELAEQRTFEDLIKTELKALQKAGGSGFMGTVTSAAATALGGVAKAIDAIRITRITGTMTGYDLKAARTGTIAIEFSIFGKAYTVDKIGIDFKNVANTIKAAAKKFMNFIK